MNEGRNIMLILRFINLFPVRIRVFVISKIFNFIIFYRNIWINYYLRILKKTGNFHKTISIINTNVFVPTDFCRQFIEEVQISHKSLIHD